MTTLKEFAARPERLSGGHRACAGCLGSTAVRMVVRAVAPEDSVVVSFATGCIEVVTTIYPYTAWRIPYIHNAFENSAATLSGVEAAYQYFRRKGKISKNRLTSRGFGETKPIDTNLTDEGRAANRRVEFVRTDVPPQN